MNPMTAMSAITRDDGDPTVSRNNEPI